MGIGEGATRVLGALQFQRVSMLLEKGTDSKKGSLFISVRDPGLRAVHQALSSSLQVNHNERAMLLSFLDALCGRWLPGGRVAQGTTCKSQRPGSRAAECDQEYKTWWDTSWLVLGK